MSAEVIDTNVLTIASAPQAGWVHPRIPLTRPELVLKVLDWVSAFRDDPERRLVLDLAGTLLVEYHDNMDDFMSYGRQVVQHKIQTSAVRWVDLAYQMNGDERVARLPEEVEALLHDLGDRKIVAAAFEASACLVNACDGDWTEPGPAAALALLGIPLVQILTDDERGDCAGSTP